MPQHCSAMRLEVFGHVLSKTEWQVIFLPIASELQSNFVVLVGKQLTCCWFPLQLCWNCHSYRLSAPLGNKMRGEYNDSHVGDNLFNVIKKSVSFYCIKTFVRRKVKCSYLDWSGFALPGHFQLFMPNVKSHILNIWLAIDQLNLQMPGP